MTALFERALGGAWAELHPEVRDRYGLVADEDRVAVGEGVMDRMTRNPLGLPVLRLAAREEFLFPRGGTEVPFTITTQAFLDGNGNEALFLRREFETDPPATFVDTLRWNPARDCIADCLGRTGRVVTDLHLEATADGGLALDIGRQWLRLRGRYVPIPGTLAVDGRLRDRFDDDADEFRVGATVRSPLVGELLGYEGRFENEFRSVEPGATTDSALVDIALPGDGASRGADG